MCATLKQIHRNAKLFEGVTTYPSKDYGGYEGCIQSSTIHLITSYCTNMNTVGKTFAARCIIFARHSLPLDCLISFHVQLVN